jgi:hypothetical protein
MKTKKNLKLLYPGTVFVLALHTDWQEEARKEVLQSFGQQNPNPEGISKLKTDRKSGTTGYLLV